MLFRILEIDANQFVWLQFVFFSVFAVTYFWAYAEFCQWKCPRCGDQFFAASFFAVNPVLLDKCQNCKLRKYEGSSL